MTLKTVSGLLVASLALAGAAHAQTSNLVFAGLNQGQGLLWTMDGNDRYTWAGSFFMHVNSADAPLDTLLGTNINVFCLDPLQHIYGGENVAFSQTTLSGLQMAATHGAEKQSAILRLLGYSNNLHNTTSDANYGTAFQVALWEIGRDYDGTAGSLDPFSGGFFYNEGSLGGNAAAVKSDVLSMLAAAGDTGRPFTTDTVFALRNDERQDLLHTELAPDRTGVVPEPGEWAAMGVLGAGLGGLVLRARRNRRA